MNEAAMNDNVRIAALRYLRRGWKVVPIPRGSKHPILQGWPNLRLDDAEIGKYFEDEEGNVGLILGEPSGNLVDVDLDAPEALVAAEIFLPKTALVHGRQSKPRSHRWYVTTTPIRTQQFRDLDGTMLVELRSTGSQTVIPPSMHPSTELIYWDSEGVPLEISATDLEHQVGLLAASSLIARHWPKQGSRQDVALALAGALLREGWSVDQAKMLIGAITTAAGDEEGRKREQAVGDTAEKIAEGQPTTGWTRLSEMVGTGVVNRMRNFLGLRGIPDVAQPAGVSKVTLPKAIGEEALYGLAGEVVRAIEPYSEADRAALLLHFLAPFGAAVGAGPFTWAGDARHALRIWPVSVGKSSKGRKGSSWAPFRRLFQESDPEIVSSRFAHGLSSGEGLILEVRDEIKKYESEGRGSNRRREWTVVDPGITDKRLLILEEEFASVLRVIQRDGSTLSPLCRCAWDHGNLRSMTKNSPLQATGAHIVILGHISRDELLRYLDRTEIANGFANRFLYVFTHRVQELPDGDRVPDEVLYNLGGRVRKAIERARGIGLMERDPEAKAMWRDLYGPLSADRPGLLGAVLNRAEAQVLRISMIYAAIDGSRLMRPEHLLAALAVWTYVAQSAAWIFGDSLGDPLADEILRALRTEGPLSRNDIYLRWGKHRGSARIDQALQLLVEYDKARAAQKATPGRPVEIWRAT